jgi:glutaredoxin
VRKTGQTGVPVIKIGGSWIVGFDKERIDKELARKAP